MLSNSVLSWVNGTNIKGHNHVKKCTEGRKDKHDPHTTKERVFVFVELFNYFIKHNLRKENAQKRN